MNYDSASTEQFNSSPSLRLSMNRCVVDSATQSHCYDEHPSSSDTMRSNTIRGGLPLEVEQRQLHVCDAWWHHRAIRTDEHVVDAHAEQLGLRALPQQLQRHPTPNREPSPMGPQQMSPPRRSERTACEQEKKSVNLSSEQASKQASKRASEQASKRASKQAEAARSSDDE